MNYTGVYSPRSAFLAELRGRITLNRIPFSERGSRLLVFRNGSALAIRLAERWSRWESEVGGYRQREPVLRNLVLHDEAGTALELELLAYPHALILQAGGRDFWLAFLDEETLYLKLPAGRMGLSFQVYAAHGRTDRRGGEFKGEPEHRSTHRNIAYTTNAAVLSNTITQHTNGYLRAHMELQANSESAFVLNITPRLGFQRRVPLSDEVLRDAEERWHSWFAAVPKVDDHYRRQYYYAWWILRAGLLSSRFYLTREAMIPSMIHYVGVWQWDAFFHAIAYRHVDHRLAEDQLRVLLDHQRADGMIPDAIHDEGVITRWKLPNSEAEVEVTKPPLIGWTALKLFSISGNRDFLDEIYDPLCRWNRWWFEKNDSDGDGIVQYNHPYSSGLDDSPLWDPGMPIESPDINTYLVLQMDSLAQIADKLGLTEESAQWRARAQALVTRLIEHFWDAQAGVFWAMHDHEPIRTLTPFNLYPLITGRLPREINDRLVAHLASPDEFWLPYPIPSVARNDPKHDPLQMWRGPTWMNINYLFIEGLARCGYTDLARKLQAKTLELVMRHNDIYEFYHPTTGDPPPKAASVFGWSSAVFVDLAIKASRGETGSFALHKDRAKELRF